MARPALSSCTTKKPCPEPLGPSAPRHMLYAHKEIKIRRACKLHLKLFKFGKEEVEVDFQPVHAQREVGARVIGLEEIFRFVEPEPLDPSFDDPLGMRLHDGEVLDLGLVYIGVTDVFKVPEDVSEDGV